jgi:hypothetical protein
MLLLLDQLESGRLINVPGCIQDIVRPESELAVASFAREIDTLADQQPSNSMSACGGLDQ